MTKIILISGRAQSGKSSTADYIQYQLTNKYRGEYTSKQYSFAAPLKRFLIDVMGLTHKQCYGTNDDKQTLTHLRWNDLPLPSDIINAKVKTHPEFMTAREVMEVFGTDICRHFYHDCWAAACKTIIANDKDEPDFALITDVRFVNELKVFDELNPYIIRLQRNPINREAEKNTDLENYIIKDIDDDRKTIVYNENMAIEDKNLVIDDILERIIKNV